MTRLLLSAGSVLAFALLAGCGESPASKEAAEPNAADFNTERRDSERMMIPPEWRFLLSALGKR